MASLRAIGASIIDLNAATAEDLDSVPALNGHGFGTVRYREERGRFTSLRQLHEVPGLVGTADGIEDYVAGAKGSPPCV